MFIIKWKPFQYTIVLVKHFCRIWKFVHASWTLDVLNFLHDAPHRFLTSCIINRVSYTDGVSYSY